MTVAAISSGDADANIVCAVNVVAVAVAAAATGAAATDDDTAGAVFYPCQI